MTTITITSVRPPIPMEQPLATEIMDAIIRRICPVISHWMYNFMLNTITIRAEGIDSVDIAKFEALGTVEVVTK